MPGNIWQLLFKNSGQQSPPILLMAEILHQLVGSLSHYLKGFIHCRWCRIPFINSITQQIYSEYSGQNPMKIWKFSLVLREAMPAYWHHLHHPRSQTAPKNHSLVSIVGVSCSSCCNNWCNWCQTSSGCVSNQSRIFSNTRGHGPFSCSIRIWAHANDPVNWRVDSGSDSALSRFCCQLSLASNCWDYRPAVYPFPSFEKRHHKGMVFTPPRCFSCSVTTNLA